MGGRLYQFGILATVMILGYLVLVHSGGAAQVFGATTTGLNSTVATFQGRAT